MKKKAFQTMVALAFGVVVASGIARAQVVPGTGQRVAQGCEDFEADDWGYEPYWPKSSRNIDGQARYPTGQSHNGMVYESALRGQPDVVKRVATPEGGLPGSKWSLLLQSKDTGIPGQPDWKSQQDDLLMNMTGGWTSVHQTPSIVVRVYMPPFDEWEDSTDTTFGLRADVRTTTTEKKRGFFRTRTRQVSKSYWPGMFIQFNSKTDPQNEQDSAYFLIRADNYGRDFLGPEIKQTGWWTLGMSFTPDGQVHYYAKPGIDDLTAKDHIASNFPYGYRAEYFQTIFFNIVSKNDGQSWSTRWIVDDPSLYLRQ